MDQDGQTPNPVIAATEAFFGDDTPLRHAHEVGGRPYEARPQQREMAVRVAEAFATGRHLLVEAPTGVGKTYAYLVPAVHFALAKGLPVVVSTHTISLQEQIVERDIPVLEQLLGVACKAALAKGRGNYLCLRRLSAVADLHQQFLPGAELVPDVERLRDWTQRTEDGSRSDLDYEPAPEVWDAVCCEVGNCLGPKCPHFRRCFLQSARRRLDGVQVIVANHALFFADLAMKRRAEDPDAGILPAYGAVVLDEGHTVEDTAATHLGVRLSRHGLQRMLRRLYHPERGRGLLADVSYSDVRQSVVEALDRAERFFDRLVRWLEARPENPLRYTAASRIPDLLGDSLAAVEERLRQVTPAEPDENRRLELAAIGVQIAEYRNGLRAFLDLALPDHVHWFERQGPNLQYLSLNAVPVEVGPLLARDLFGADVTVVVTSATLAVRGKMAYFRQRIGVGEGDELILSSPFDFLNQVTLYVPMDMPNPNDPAQFVPAACEHIRRFLLKTEGKAFVLFTSYRMMQDVAAAMSGFFAHSGLRLLVQGEGMPRTKMLDVFRREPNSVIFGTDSFWMGVDVPGEALSNVIIVKLPFPVPDHPLVAARGELIERRGGRPFWDYSLPEAVLKFRQGFGRLIRSRDDRGIVVVLDNRILHSSYGKVFLESLPPCSRQVF